MIREWKAPPRVAFHCGVGGWADTPGPGSPYATGWKAGHPELCQHCSYRSISACWCPVWDGPPLGLCWASPLATETFLFLSILVGSSGYRTIHAQAGCTWEVEWRPREFTVLSYFKFSGPQPVCLLLSTSSVL